MSSAEKDSNPLLETLELKKKELAVYQQCKDSLNLIGMIGGVLVFASCLFTMVVMLLGHFSELFDKISHVGLIFFAVSLAITLGIEIGRAVIVKKKRREIADIVRRIKNS